MSEPRWIKLNNGQYTCVDDEDYEKLVNFNWLITPQGYVARSQPKTNKNGIKINSKVLMHREVMGLTPNDKQHVDHINREKLDNTKSNLRLCTPSQNHANAKRKSETGYTGVMVANKNKPCQTYRASVWVNGIQHMRHGFKTAEEAALAYNEMAIQHFGEFARLNEVPQC